MKSVDNSDDEYKKKELKRNMAMEEDQKRRELLASVLPNIQLRTKFMTDLVNDRKLQ